MKNKSLNVDLRGLIHLGKSSGEYFITTIINQAIPFLILPILTRYLSPAEYGSFALFSFYLAISNSLAGISIPTVISKYFFNSEKKYMAEIIGNSILIVGILSLIVALLILVIYPFAHSFLDLPLLWLLIIPLASFSFIVFNMGLNVMQNSKKVLLFGKHTIGNTVVNILVSIVLVVVLLWGWYGRALGIIISYFISAIISFYYLKKQGYISFKFSKDVSKNILRVVIPLIPNSFQVTIISQVGIFFLQYYYTKDLLGLYSIGFQIAVMIQLLVTTLSMSWGPFLFEQLSKENLINKLYLTRLIYALAGVLVAGVLFIDFTSGLILKIMTTPDYYGALEFIPWFTLGFLFYGIYVFIYPILIKHEKQRYISMITFLNMFIMIVFNILFVKIFGYIGVAYAYCLTYFLMFLAFFWKAQKVMPLPWLKALKIWN